MNKLIRMTVYLSALSWISGCSIYSSEFDCAPGRSVGCASLSQVNALVNNDFLDEYIGSENSNYSERVGQIRGERQRVARERAREKRDQLAHSVPHSNPPKNEHILDLPLSAAAQQKEKVIIWFKEEGV